jgi:predicted glycosyltransferase involved in capsule biosynthesis
MEDISGIRVYDDNWKEGDEPITLGDLPEYEKIKGSHDKFRSILNRAKSLNKESTEALDDKYLEEKVKKVVRKVINENKLWDAMLNDMKKFANSGKDVYDFIDFASKKYGIDEDRFYTSGGYEEWCSLTGEDPLSYEI